MATKQQPTNDVYRCPVCSGVLACVSGSWGCTSCRYVPAHGAD